jgi:uncharacterized membrane protein SirB2
MSYLALKHIHLTCVVLSIAGFSLRGWWMLSDSPRLKLRLTRILPHLVDTLLLVSALAMAWMSSQYPFVSDWLTAKLLGLIAYILFGVFALKRGKTKSIRALCLILALMCFGYVAAVAITRSPGIGLF